MSTVLSVAPKPVDTRMNFHLLWMVDDGTGRWRSWSSGSTSPAAARYLREESFFDEAAAVARFDELMALREAGEPVAAAAVRIRVAHPKYPADESWQILRIFPDLAAW